MDLVTINAQYIQNLTEDTQEIGIYVPKIYEDVILTKQSMMALIYLQALLGKTDTYPHKLFINNIGIKYLIDKGFKIRVPKEDDDLISYTVYWGDTEPDIVEKRCPRR